MVSHVPPLGLSENALKEIARNQEIRDKRVKEEALEFQQQVSREAETQVLRLQTALSAEAADNFAHVANAQQRLASVEQMASFKLAQAEEII